MIRNGKPTNTIVIMEEKEDQERDKKLNYCVSSGLLTAFILSILSVESGILHHISEYIGFTLTSILSAILFIALSFIIGFIYAKIFVFRDYRK